MKKKDVIPKITISIESFHKFRSKSDNKIMHSLLNIIKKWNKR